MKVYSLVMVCILTEATSILSLEWLETQNVVAAIEQHSAGHGVPRAILIDNDTQLMVMQHAAFCPWTLKNHVREQVEIRVVVSCAKALEERGQVERRILMIPVVPVDVEDHHCQNT